MEIDAKAATVSPALADDRQQESVAMAIDTKDHRLFSGCRSGVMAVSDYQVGTVVTTDPASIAQHGARSRRAPPLRRVGAIRTGPASGRGRGHRPVVPDSFRLLVIGR